MLVTCTKFQFYGFSGNSDRNDRETGNYMETSNAASVLLENSGQIGINLKVQPSRQGVVSYLPELARNLAL